MSVSVVNVLTACTSSPLLSADTHVTVAVHFLNCISAWALCVCVCVCVSERWRNSQSSTVHQYWRTCPYMFLHTVALFSGETQHMQHLSMQALCEAAVMWSLYLGHWTSYTARSCKFLFPSQPPLGLHSGHALLLNNRQWSESDSVFFTTKLAAAFQVIGQVQADKNSTIPDFASSW